MEEKMTKLILENNILKEKNTQLAKALADQKAMYAEGLKVQDELHRNFIDSKRNIQILTKGFKKITGLFSRMDGPFVEAGDELKYFLTILQSGNKVDSHLPPAIHRPTANLARISAEQLVQMNASGNSGSGVPGNHIPETTNNNTEKQLLETCRSGVDSNTLLDVSSNAGFTRSGSTPYMRTDIVERRHIAIDDNKENDSDSHHQGQSVTRKRHAVLPNRTSYTTNHAILPKEQNAANGFLKNCCVKITKLSLMDLMKYQSKMVSETEMPKNSVEVKTSKPQRAKRPLNLKEPTLRHKMRR